MKTYIVHYETERHIGFKSCRYGELTELKRLMKENGERITEIECLANGRIIEVKEF